MYWFSICGGIRIKKKMRNYMLRRSSVHTDAPFPSLVSLSNSSFYRTNLSTKTIQTQAKFILVRNKDRISSSSMKHEKQDGKLKNHHTRERERSKISARWHSRWGITISSIIIYIIWAKTPLLNDQYNRYTVQTIWQYCFFFSCSFLPPFCLYFDTSLSTKDFHIHMIITYRKNTWRKEKNTPNIPSTQ